MIVSLHGIEIDGGRVWCQNESYRFQKGESGDRPFTESVN